MNMEDKKQSYSNATKEEIDMEHELKMGLLES